MALNACTTLSKVASDPEKTQSNCDLSVIKTDKIRLMVRMDRPVKIMKNQNKIASKV